MARIVFREVNNKIPREREKTISFNCRPFGLKCHQQTFQSSHINAPGFNLNKSRRMETNNFENKK